LPAPLWALVEHLGGVDAFDELPRYIPPERRAALWTLLVRRADELYDAGVTPRRAGAITGAAELTTLVADIVKQGAAVEIKSSSRLAFAGGMLRDLFFRRLSPQRLLEKVLGGRRRPRAVASDYSCLFQAIFWLARRPLALEQHHALTVHGVFPEQPVVHTWNWIVSADRCAIVVRDLHSEARADSAWEPSITATHYPNVSAFVAGLLARGAIHGPLEGRPEISPVLHALFAALDEPRLLQLLFHVGLNGYLHPTVERRIAAFLGSPERHRLRAARTAIAPIFSAERQLELLSPALRRLGPWRN
jgi:hypothetical protein